MNSLIKPYIVLSLLFLNFNFLSASDKLDNNSFAPLQLKFFSKEISINTYQYKIEINTDQIAQLNSITIGLPCGKISKMNNSENWPVRYDVLDRQSGIYGFKLSNNKGGKPSKSMVISFEITALGDYCQNIFETWRPKLAYRYGGKVYQETLASEKTDIPLSSIDLATLSNTVNDEHIEISAYNDEETHETIFDVISQKSEEISLEIYNTSGIKISTMFIGKLKEGIRNFITFNYDVLADRHYIFKLSSSTGELYGKLNLPKQGL